jgi:phosphatidylcholine synthase
LDIENCDFEFASDFGFEVRLGTQAMAQAADLAVDPGRRRRRRRFKKVLAWCVHAYTALGLVAAAGIAVLIVRGGVDSFRWAFALMLVATLIDATDGTLARAIRIKEVLPNFDGRRLDDLVDFLTYTFLPLFLLWRADIPAGWTGVLLMPLLASAYGFCQVSIKTDDGYFLGFPSYWNLMAFYLYVLQPLPVWLSVGLLVTFSLLTFVPTRYLYPSQRGRLNRITNFIAAVWTIFVVWILAELPAEGYNPAVRLLALASLFFPVYYLAASWLISVHYWRRRHSTQRSGSQPATGTLNGPRSIEASHHAR